MFVQRGSRFAAATAVRQHRVMSTAPSMLDSIKARVFPPPDVDMSTPFPGVSPPEKLEPSDSSTVSVSTLENGVKVASSDNFQQAGSVGLFLDFGSRDESPHETGTCHLLERMAFKSSSEFSHTRVVHEMETYGAGLFCERSKETLTYGMESLKSTLPEMLEVFLSTVMRPNLEASELDEQKKIIQEVEMDGLKTNNFLMTLESFHNGAYGNDGLGLSQYAGIGNSPIALQHINRDSIQEFLANNLRGPRVCLAGVGVEHDLLVGFAQNHLSGLVSDVGPTTRSAKYQGGVKSTGLPTQDGSLNMMIGFEGCPEYDDDMVAFLGLNQLLGGGSSFSAGGPGKGLYTRLYTRVLNKHSWITEAQALNMSYSDAGFFGIYGGCAPQHGNKLFEVLMTELQNAAKNISDVEMSRVKKMLKSFLLTQLEHRNVVMEDIGKQVLSRGAYIDAKSWSDQIDALTTNDLARVSERMLATPLVVGLHGDSTYVSFHN